EGPADTDDRFSGSRIGRDQSGIVRLGHASSFSVVGLLSILVAHGRFVCDRSTFGFSVFTGRSIRTHRRTLQRIQDADVLLDEFLARKGNSHRLRKTHGGSPWRD